MGSCVQPMRDKTPNSALYRALLNLKWSVVRELLKHPDSDHLVGYCETIIHVACAYDAPVDIIKSILRKKYPYQVLYQEDTSKNTPLHLVIRYASNEDLFHFVLDKAPLTANIPNKVENLPLHLAIFHRRNPNIIRTLLVSYPGAMNVPNKEGDTPLQVFFRMWHDVLVRMRQYHNHSFSNVQKYHEAYREMNYIKTLLLLFAKMYVNESLSKEEEEDTQFFTLHNVIQMKGIPHIYLLLILDLFPEQARVQDKQGNLPLHIAVMQEHCTYRMFESIYSKNVDSCRVRNKDGTLAFNLAIGCGIDWESGILQMIMKRAPDSLIQRDVKTGLVPFAIACCREKVSLNTAYNVLLSDPSVLHQALKKV